MEREREALLRLIAAKQHLALPAPPPPPARGVGPGPGAGALSADMWLDLYSANALTRAAGGRVRAAAPAPRRLVVDVREFMSSLPAVLHQKARRRGGAARTPPDPCARWAQRSSG